MMGMPSTAETVPWFLLDKYLKHLSIQLNFSTKRGAS